MVQKKRILNCLKNYKQFLIIQSEEFLRNTSKTYNDVLKFLGLPNWEPKEFVLYKKRPYKEKISSN